MQSAGGRVRSHADLAGYGRPRSRQARTKKHVADIKLVGCCCRLRRDVVADKYVIAAGGDVRVKPVGKSTDNYILNASGIEVTRLRPQERVKRAAGIGVAGIDAHRNITLSDRKTRQRLKPDNRVLIAGRNSVPRIAGVVADTGIKRTRSDEPTGRKADKYIVGRSSIFFSGISADERIVVAGGTQITRQIPDEGRDGRGRGGDTGLITQKRILVTRGNILSRLIAREQVLSAAGMQQHAAAGHDRNRAVPAYRVAGKSKRRKSGDGKRTRSDRGDKRRKMEGDYLGFIE